MTYEIDPVRIVVDTEGDKPTISFERCEPAQADRWGVYKRANRPDDHGHKLARWLADFADRVQAQHYVNSLPKDEPISPEWEDYTNRVAFQAAYLMAGANAELKKRDEIDLSEIGGHLGLTEIVVDNAKLVADFLEAPDRKDLDFPGVFEYEVTEALGAWLAGNYHCTPNQFQNKLEHEFTKFIMGKESRPATMAEIDAALSPAWPFTGKPNAVDLATGEPAWVAPRSAS